MVRVVSADEQIILSSVPIIERCIGLVFASAGALGVFAFLAGWIDTITVDHAPIRPTTPFDAWLPAIPFLIGIGLLFRRHREILHVDRKIYLQTNGWGFWTRCTERSLAESTGIIVGPREDRGYGKSRRWAFPIRIIGPDGFLELAAPKTEIEGSKFAEQIAQELALPLEKRLVSIVQSLGGATESLLTGTGVLKSSDLVPPSNTRVMTADLPRGMEIRYPMTHSKVDFVLSITVPALFLNTVWLLGVRPMPSGGNSTSLMDWLIMMAPSIIVLMVGLGVAFRSGLLGGRIYCDIDGVLRSLGKQVPADQIRAIYVVPGPELRSGLQVVLPSKDFLIAKGQSEADLKWMKALILKNLGAIPDVPNDH